MPTAVETVNALALEDEYTDVIQKARRGLGYSVDEVVYRAGITKVQWDDVLTDRYEAEVLNAVAYVLNLHGPSLLELAKGTWKPQSCPHMEGWAAFTTPFGSDMTVNAYLVWDPETKIAASFDTGTSCNAILETIRSEGLKLRYSFITHTHLDHLADLDRLMEETGSRGYGPAIENPLGLNTLSHGDGFVLGAVKIRAIGTPGHTPGGTSYCISGLPYPIVVVGDALFAGSMGGAYQAYETAHRKITQQILTLPDDTLIAPGHGPMTTVGEEKAHNPFFPHLKS